MENKKEKNIMSKIILVIILSMILLTIIVALNNFNEILYYLRHANVIYLWLSLFVLMLFITIYPIKYVSFAYANNFDVSLKDAYIIGGSEFFYNTITPFHSGGQPFIIYKFNKLGIKPHQSSGMMITIFLVSQIAFILLAIFSIIFNWALITNELSHLSVFLLLGAVINIVYLIFVICLGTSIKFKIFVSKFLNLIMKIKFLQRFSFDFESFANDAQRVFKEIAKSKLEMTISLIVKLFTLMLSYSLPFLALRAVGVNIPLSYLLVIITLMSLLIVMATWVITPGATGGMEFFFIALFSSILVSEGYATDNQIISALLIWRFISFYGLFIISSVFYVISNKRISKYNKIKLKEIVVEETIKNNDC